MIVVQAIKNDILVSLTHCFDRIYAKRNKQKQNKIIISNRTDDNYSYSIRNAACDIESDHWNPLSSHLISYAVNNWWNKPVELGNHSFIRLVT